MAYSAMRASAALLTALFSVGCGRPTIADRSDSRPDETIWSEAGGLRLKIEVYKSAKLSAHPTLILVLHGDLLEARVPPTYHYEFARRMARSTDGVILAALLRPGYTDGAGDQSGGSRGLATGDNYTPQVVNVIGQSVQQLQAKFQPSATLLAGHSGGAVIAADLLGVFPSLAQAAFLVGCPCDVPAWRKYMAKTQLKRIGPFSALFLLPAKIVSPLDLAAQVPRSAKVRLIVGSRDATAPPRFSQEYASALRGNGVDVAVAILPGLEHNILLQPVVEQQLQQLLRSIQSTSEAVLPASFHRMAASSEPARLAPGKTSKNR